MERFIVLSTEMTKLHCF